MPDAAPDEPARERPFFVVGQWSGSNVHVWAVLEAPVDAAERSDALEEILLDTDDAFGSANVVFAASAAEAEATARREAVETALQMRQRNRRPGTGSHRRVSHSYR
ncbi:hypothetical protein [Streptomyces sviceus]|uniref:hypothetical protein n=1 Tax=Streptomyces sviceus TaxID=285530 RepID=UPI003684FA02